MCKRGETMACVVERIDETTAILTTEKGYKATIHFLKEDNPDIENIVTDNLLTSYERRIKMMAVREE